MADARPLCAKCRQEYGDSTEPATHRLVARGKAEERDPQGRERYVYADMPEIALCEAHVEAMMTARRGAVARTQIEIIAELQKRAQEQGLTFAPNGSFGGAFDWGFADIWKPLWLVTAEMADPRNYRIREAAKEG